MRFANQQFLWLAIVLIPLIAMFLVWSWRKKQKLISQFVASRLLAILTVGVSQTRQKARLILLGLTATLALLAMARPQWGFDWEEAKMQGLDILVAIDTSKSMLANDVAPTRLARAKMAAFDLMKLAKSDRLGLIAFAGSAFLQTPLTLDEEAFRQNVETLDVGIIPQGGTALGEAIDTATKAFETSGDNYKVLVLFTDGEDQDTGATEAAAKAAKAGIKIYTIGIGSADGELIRVPDEHGTVGFLKDEQGNVVKSRLNETLLQQIATTGNGFYLPLRGANPMETLYQRGLASLPKNESTTKLVQNFRERFHWPLGLAIIFLIAEMFLPQRRRVRLDDSATMATNPNLKKAVALLILLLLPASLFSSPAAAMKKYQSGQYDAALTDYQRLLRQKTNDYRLYYNAGDAAYQAKQFDDAKKYFDTAIVSPDLGLQQRAYYNLGNTLYQMGDKAEMDKKQESWEQAIRNYQNALALNTNDLDAKHNLQFVQKMIEELKKQQQQSKDNKKDKNDKNDQSKEDQQKQQDQKDQKDKKDQKDQKKDQQQAKDQDQQKNDEQKQKEQQKKDQAKDEEQKKNQQAQQQQAKKEGDDKQEEQPGDPGRVAQMTPEEAKQFLEAMKQEDRALIFKPPEKEGRARVLKDW